MRILLLAAFVFLAGLVYGQPDQPKAVGRLTKESLTQSGLQFDALHSRGVFIGVNVYQAAGGVRPSNLKSCVNDAVDLATAFWELGLIEPAGITLVLSGDPSKPDSISALEKLYAAGATIAEDARRDTIDYHVSNAATSAGADGILVITWSAHGFDAGGVQYLTPENFYSMTERPSVGEISGRAISEATLSAVAQASPAGRRILLFDACRETRTLGVGIPELIGDAVGTVTLYAATSGDLAVDGSRNGAFTTKILEALRSPTPPKGLRADRFGYITIGTLLEYLGTAGRIEDPKILAMPLREHPLQAIVAKDREIALGRYIAASQKDLKAPEGERHLGAMPVEVVEEASYSDSGPRLIEEILKIFPDNESCSDPSKRLQFSIAWRNILRSDPSLQQIQIEYTNPGKAAGPPLEYYTAIERARRLIEELERDASE